LSHPRPGRPGASGVAGVARPGPASSYSFPELPAERRIGHRADPDDTGPARDKKGVFVATNETLMELPVMGADLDSSGDLTTELLTRDFWTDGMLARAGIPVVDVPFVSVGGGIGSFVTVDYLRIAGVPADSVAVLTLLDKPWDTYEYLTRVSQIPRHERLRSDSASTPDCIWGFPGYALRESLSGRRWAERLAPLFQVAVEPVLADYFTPRAGQVFDALEREHRRATAERWSRGRFGWYGDDTAGVTSPSSPPERRRSEQAHRLQEPVRPPSNRLSRPPVPARPAGLPRPPP